MRKRRRKLSLWLSFLNSDIARIEILERLTKVFTNRFEVDKLEFDSESVSKAWKNQVIEKRDDLKMFQISMRTFIDEYILHHKANNLNERELNNFEQFIKKGSDKFKSIENVRNVRVLSKNNIVDNVIIPGLCYEFIRQERYWNLILSCLECRKYFIAKTRRHQFYCSKKCKDNHRNRKRVKSEWAGYMREYRNKLRV